MNKFVKVGFIVLLLSNVVILSSSNSAELSSQDLQNAIRKGLQEKVKLSGTLDLFDNTLNKARNLQWMECKEVNKQGEEYVALIDYRDIHSGDVVTVEVVSTEENGNMVVKNTTIKNVVSLTVQKGAEEKKDFPDKEIQEVMNNYVTQQAKFTGSFMLFDETNNKMRTLQLVSIEEKVRRFGILFISTAEFKDLTSSEVVLADITAENQQGQLNVKSVKIKTVNKPKT